MSNWHLVKISRKLNNICGQDRVQSDPFLPTEMAKKSLFCLTLNTMLSTNIIQFSWTGCQVSVRHLTSACTSNFLVRRLQTFLGVFYCKSLKSLDFWYQNRNWNRHKILHNYSLKKLEVHALSESICNKYPPLGGYRISLVGRIVSEVNPLDPAWLFYVINFDVTTMQRIAYCLKPK